MVIERLALLDPVIGVLIHMKIIACDYRKMGLNTGVFIHVKINVCDYRNMGLDPGVLVHMKITVCDHRKWALLGRALGVLIHM